MSEYSYSSQSELQALSKKMGFSIPSSSTIVDPEQSVASLDSTMSGETDIPDEYLGEYTGEMIKKYAPFGWRPTLKQAKAYRKFEETRKVDGLKIIGEAVANATSDLAQGGLSLVGDTVTLKAHKVAGSIIEGGAQGTMSWIEMFNEARLNESSWLHKLMFNTNSSDEDYHLNLNEALNARQIMAEDQAKGYLIPNKVNIGGLDLELTNPNVVRAVSYVADPSWFMPALGIEGAIFKSLKGGAEAVGLGGQMARAGAYSLKKVERGLAKSADGVGWVVNGIDKANEVYEGILKNVTGYDHNIAQQGNPIAKDSIVRSAENALGFNILKIPAWPLTAGVWGIGKVLEGGLRTSELAVRLLGEESKIAGLNLAERVAMESQSAPVRTMASFYAKTGSPLVEWAGSTVKTSLHSSMYGGLFGVAFGGEEGFYHGLGTGFALGGAFHQLGVFHNTIAGGNAIMDTVKNFNWATAHYDYHQQEGTYRLLKNVEEKGGMKAKLRVMAQIGTIERVLRDEKFRILTDEKIRALANDENWTTEERAQLEDPNWGGITFGRSSGGSDVIIVNADRATNSAINEELFHGILLNSRYGKAFKKKALDALIGTEGAEGALYKMPRNEAINLLTGFRDQYLMLDKSLGGHDPARATEMYARFNSQIEKFANGERPPEIRGIFEEFLGAYWNRFLDDKPIDYLLKSGDLGLIRNVIEGGKDLYLNIMAKDLKDAGAHLASGVDADSFLIDQRTKQRVRIPALDALMKHFARETRNKWLVLKNGTQGRYTGWEVTKGKYNDNFTLMTAGLEHLVTGVDANGRAILMSKEEGDALETESLTGMIAELRQLNDRGLQMIMVDDNNKTVAHFSPSKKKEDFWKVVADKLQAQAEKEFVGPKPAKKKNQTDPEDVIQGANLNAKNIKSSGVDGSFSQEGKFKLKIIGLATEKELEIVRKYTNENTAKRFAELNGIVERSRAGRLEDMNNIVKATVLTEASENDDGSRGGSTKRLRTYLPVELSISITKKKGEKKPTAKMRLLTIDMDALDTRGDYAWNSLDEGDVDYRDVRRLFGRKEELMESVKAMLSHYSNSESDEAGIKLFAGGSGSERDWAMKRDIVNAVIGAHPTKSMENTKSGWENRPLEMQFRQKGMKDELPTVYTNFLVRNIGNQVSLEGEGFKYNHERAYERSQINYSPAKTHRDHEGNPVPSGVSNVIKNSLHLNKEGENITVYGLRTPYSETIKSGGLVFDSLTGKVVDSKEANLSSVNRNVGSTNGWHHYTSSPYEAGFVANDTLSVGYINTQRHLDLAGMPHATDAKGLITTLADRVASLTGRQPEFVLADILKLKTANDVPLAELYNNESTDIFNQSGIEIEEALLHHNNIKFFVDNNIHSVEYKRSNPLSGREFNAVALLDNRRFYENNSIPASATERFMFSPSKKKTVSQNLEEILRLKGRSTGLGNDIGLFLNYIVDKNGNIIENPHKITHETVEKEILFTKEWVTEAQNAVSDFKRGLYDRAKQKEYIEALAPLLARKLKYKFKQAPSEKLLDVARYALEGFVQSYDPTSGQTASKIIKDSLLIHSLKKYGINPESIAQTGIPSLGHWVELSHSEARGLTTLVNDLASGKFPEGKGIKKYLKEKPLVARLLEKNGGGIANVFAELSNRHKELLKLVDLEGTKFAGNPNTDGSSLGQLSQKELADLMIEKSRALIEGHLKTNKGKGNSELLEITKYYNMMVEAGRSPTKEGLDAHAKVEEIKRRAEAIVHRDARDRILNIMTAYNITNLDPVLIDKVRAQLYYEQTQGLIQLGTPDVLARATELYAMLGGDEKIKEIFDIQEAIKSNYLKSLEEAEKKGYYGLHWVERNLVQKFDENGNLAGYNGTIKVGSSESGSQRTLEDVKQYWSFKGTNHTVVLQRVGVDNLITLFDELGKPMLYQNIKLIEPESVQKEIVKTFLRESSSRVIKEAPDAGIANYKGQELEGDVKDFYFRKYAIERNQPSLIKDIDNHRIFKFGDEFIAYRTNEIKPKEESYMSQLNIESNKTFKTVKGKRVRISDDEKIRSREKLAEIQGRVYGDYGFTFSVDKRNFIRLGETFKTLEDRARWLVENQRGKTKHGDFDAWVSEMYNKHEEYVKMLSQEEGKQIERVVRDSGEGSAFSEIRKRMSQIQKLEAKRRNLIVKETNEYNGERRANAEGKGGLISFNKAEERLTKKLEEADEVKEATREKLIAISIQLQEFGVPESLDLLRKLGDESLYEDAKFHLERGIGENIESTKIPRDPSENPALFVQRLRGLMTENEAIYLKAKSDGDVIREALNESNEDIIKLKEEIYFLTKRYIYAKGHIFDTRQLDLDKLFIKVKGKDDAFATTQYKYDKVKSYETEKRNKPEYLYDDAGTLGEVEKRNTAVEDAEADFRMGISDIESQWNNGRSREKITYQEILGMGRASPNTENSIPDEIKRRMNTGDFTAEEVVFIKDPANRDLIRKIDEKLTKNTMTLAEAKEIVTDAYLTSSFGADSVELRKTQTVLDDTTQKIGELALQLKIMANNGAQGVDLTTIHEKIAELRGKRELFQERKTKILQKAIENPNASEKWREMARSIFNRDQEDVGFQIRREEIRRAQQDLKKGIKVLVQQYAERGRRLTKEGPEGIDSSMVVSPSNPRTQALITTYPTISNDFFGAVRQWDLSLSTDKPLSKSLWGQEGPEEARNTTTEGSKLSAQLRRVLDDERKVRRPIVVADYMYRADVKQNWYKQHPSARMTAEDAHLIQTFFPDEVQKSDTLRKQIESIPKEVLEKVEQRGNGILDLFDTKTERGRAEERRLIRSFVLDALDIISNNNAMKMDALRRLKGMDQKAFDKWVEEVGIENVEPLLKTKEVIENAMYLIKGGRIDAGEAGKAIGYRDTALDQEFSPSEKNILQKFKIKNGLTQKQFEDLVLGVTPPTNNLPADVLRILTRNKEDQFKTRGPYGSLPIDTLINHAQFESIWKEELENVSQTSFFGDDKVHPIKRRYEQMPMSSRLSIQAPTVTRWLAENSANSQRMASEVWKRNKAKGVISWGGKDEAKRYDWNINADIARQEHAFTLRLLDTVIKPVEASLDLFTGQITTLLNKRPFAVDHLLSLTGDGLQIAGATRNKKGQIVVDWANKDKPQYRETENGKYAIRRNTTTNKKGEVKETFDVYFGGEAVKNKSGVMVLRLDPHMFARVTDISQAQVAIRLFENDMLALRRTSELLSGGHRKDMPLKAGNVEIPMTQQNALQAKQRGMLLDGFDSIPHFTRAVINAYETKVNRDPKFRSTVTDEIRGLRELREPVYIQLNKGNGKVEKKIIHITPSEEALISNKWVKGTSPDGHTRYTYTEPKPVEPATVPSQDVYRPEARAVGEQGSNFQLRFKDGLVDFETPDNPKVTKEDDILSASSKWTVDSTIAPNKENVLEEWSVITNELGYIILRVKESQKKDVFRLFNRARAYLSQYDDETDAVSEAFNDAMKGKK
jgi:hypothetical protein